MENLRSDTICRTCMSKGQNFHSVLEYESMSKLRISVMLMTTVPQLKIQPGDDGLPVVICGVCLYKLNVAYRYQQLCIQTDRTLKEMLVHDQEDPDDEQQQEENHLDMETKQKQVLLLKDTAPDTLLSLYGDCIKIENESECQEFLSDHEDDRDGLFKKAVVDTAPVETGEGPDDADDYNGNESDVEWNDEIDESESEWKEFLSDPEKDGDDIFKAVAVGKTLANPKKNSGDGKNDNAHDSDGNSSNVEWNNKSDSSEMAMKPVKPHHNETGVNEIKKPGVRNRRKGHYPCPECLKDFDRPYCLRRHIVVHSKKRLHACDICNYRFTTESLLKRHKTTHSNDAVAKKETPADGYKCPECPRSFEKRNSLIVHIQNHRYAIPKQRFQCEYCPKQFTNIEPLKKHEHAHTEKQQFECHVCGKVFKKKKSLNEHINTHTGETPHICSLCGKSFAHRSPLRRHILRHSDEKRFPCKQCPSKFSCVAYLNKHMSIHRSGNAHICDICGSSFSRPYALKIHKQIHSGNRPYKCEQCNKSFAVSEYLRCHMLKHIGQEQHKCKYCNRSYAESKYLHRHLRSHVGENTYMCDECPNTFKYKYDLQLHKTQHSKRTLLELETATAIVSAVETEPSATKTTMPEVVLSTAIEKVTTPSIIDIN